MGKGNIIVGFSKVGSLGIGLITVSAYGAAKGAGVNLGLSDGGIEVGYQSSDYLVEVDNALAAIDALKTKEQVVIKTNIAESSLANLATAFGYPSGAVSGGNTLKVGGDFTLDKKTVYIDVNGPDGGTRELTAYMAIILGDAKHTYKKADKTMIPVTITLLQDLTRTAGDQLFSIVDSALDSTPPTVVMSTPAPSGNVTKNTKGTIVFTITETNGMDQSSIRYGDTVNIYDLTVPGLVAGAIAYDVAAKTITFTPTSNWTASDSLQAVITTGLKDAAGNRLATQYIAALSVTA